MEIAYSSELERINTPKTKTATFALPFIVSSKSKLVNFMNCFLRNVDYPDYLEHIFPVFRDEDKPSYVSFLEKLRNDENFHFEYMFDEENRTFCFQVPHKYKSDFSFFEQSRYSEMSEDAKKQILHFHGKNSTSNIAKRLYLDEEMYIERENDLNVKIPRENEIISALNPKKETLTHDLKVNYHYEPSK